jgi:hypothetical protein
MPARLSCSFPTALPSCSKSCFRTLIFAVLPFSLTPHSHPSWNLFLSSSVSFFTSSCKMYPALLCYNLCLYSGSLFSSPPNSECRLRKNRFAPSQSLCSFLDCSDLFCCLVSQILFKCFLSGLQFLEMAFRVLVIFCLTLFSQTNSCINVQIKRC